MTGANVKAARFAAPSWVMPGDIEKNAVFLEGRVREIGLCFFETKASLAYGAADLPKSLADLDVDWHAHLPADLPWEAGGAIAADICARLLEKIAFLKPRAAVLHPPRASRQSLLGEFARAWDNNRFCPVLLENVAYCDVYDLGGEFLHKHDFGFCLDVAHAMTYGQWRMLASALPEKAALWHWSAPGDGDEHLPLTRLAPAELGLAKTLLRRAAPDAIQMLEIFDWRGAPASMAILENLRAEA